MTPRQAFKSAYRIGRLIPHKHACTAAMKKTTLPESMLYAGILCAIKRKTGEHRFALQCRKSAMADGRSGRKCIALHKRAIEYRMRNRR